jgi:hypothetical protein
MIKGANKRTVTLTQPTVLRNPKFCQSCANWVHITADVIKQQVPEMKLVCPPFTSGHHDDGAPNWGRVPMDVAYRTVPFRA